MKREGEWEVKPLPVHGYQVVDSEGREIVRDVYRKEDAERIVKEHNAIAFAVRNGENWTLTDWQNWLRWHVSQSPATTSTSAGGGRVGQIDSLLSAFLLLQLRDEEIDL